MGFGTRRAEASRLSLHRVTRNIPRSPSTALQFKYRNGDKSMRFQLRPTKGDTQGQALRTPGTHGPNLTKMGTSPRPHHVPTLRPHGPIS